MSLPLLLLTIVVQLELIKHYHKLIDFWWLILSNCQNLDFSINAYLAPWWTRFSKILCRMSPSLHSSSSARDICVQPAFPVPTTWLLNKEISISFCTPQFVLTKRDADQGTSEEGERRGKEEVHALLSPKDETRLTMRQSRRQRQKRRGPSINDVLKML